MVLHVLPFHLHRDVCEVLDKLLNLGWGREMAELRAGMGTGGRGELVGPFGGQISPTKLSRRIRHLPCWICTTRMAFVGESAFRASVNETKP